MLRTAWLLYLLVDRSVAPLISDHINQIMPDIIAVKRIYLRISRSPHNIGMLITRDWWLSHIKHSVEASGAYSAHFDLLGNSS